MKTKLILLSAVIVLLVGCGKSKVTIRVEHDGAEFSISIPQDATAAQLIHLRGIMDNALTIKAERERMAFVIEQRKQAAREREFYVFILLVSLLVGVFGVVCIASAVIIWRNTP